jgi:cysteine desulfurase
MIFLSALTDIDRIFSLASSAMKIFQRMASKRMSMRKINPLSLSLPLPRPRQRFFSSSSMDKSSSADHKPVTDKRYEAVNTVPEQILRSMQSDEIHSPGFSIRGESLAGRPAYLDFQATTPQDPRVLDAMLPFMMGRFGNPHSKTHAFGWESELAVEQAREHIAKLIGASAKEIIFTSGATESNNMALKGVARFYKGKKNHIITTQTEHKCVLDSCRALEAEGFSVTYLPVKLNGLVDLEVLSNAIRPETAIVSVMGVNNEIGVVQPLREIGEVS